MPIIIVKMHAIANNNGHFEHDLIHEPGEAILDNIFVGGFKFSA